MASIGLYAGTLSQAFSNIFTSSDKITGLGYNVPGLISTTYNASGNLLANNLTKLLVMAGISPGSAVGMAIGEGMSGAFHTGQPFNPFSGAASLTQPESVIARRYMNNESLSFPPDILLPFMSFEFGEYQKKNPWSSGEIQTEGGPILFADS